MDPIIEIINYIFEKNNVHIIMRSIDSFFEDGDSFPNLVKLLFRNVEFPIQIILTINKSYKESNNNLTLQFLFDNNKEIANLKPNYDNEEERKNLLSLILSKQYLQNNCSDIISKCNNITRTIGIIFKDENEFIKISTLVTILHVLTNGLIEKNSTNKYDQDLKNIFQKARVPLVINEESLTQPYTYQFYIQIEIIFDVFSESENYKKIIQEELDESLLNYKFNYPKSTRSSDKYDELPKIQDSILKTINAIGQKGGFHFDSFIQIIKDDLFPRFVMYFLNIPSIENVIFQADQTVTQKVKNIEAVIEFLKTKDEIFRVLLFNFRNPKTVEESLITLIINFLNVFYIGDSKEMIQKRANSIFYIKINQRNDYYKQFIGVLQFYIREKLTLNKDQKITDEIAQDYFKKAKVPMIVNQFLLENRNYFKFEIMNFQWKLIFDTVDADKPHFKIIENFSNALKSFQKIKVPRYELITSNIKSINASLKRLNNIQITESAVKKEIQSKNEADLPIYFKQRIKKTVDSQVEKEVHKIEENQSIENYEKFWSNSEKFLSFDNGIIYDEMNFKNDNKNSITQWELEMKKNDFKKNEASENESGLLGFKSSSNNFESKLYKLCIYDENEKEWTYNNSNFKELINDKKINLSNSTTSLISVLESFEEDSKSIISNMINGLFPNLEDEEQIFVYAFCDRTLSMLNYSIDFTNMNSTKPIFLLLHVPKSKENIPNIEIIVTQMYAFLSLISNLKIIILDKNHYVNQIQFIENIFNIIKNYSNDLEIFPNKFLFLVNQKTFDSNQEIEEKMKNESLFSNLISQINMESKVTFINILNTKTYRSFLNLFNEFILKDNISTDFVDTLFEVMYRYIFNGFYLYLKFQISTWKEDMKKIILKRFSSYETKEKYKNNQLGILFKIQKEILKAFAFVDSDFLNECKSIISELKEELIQKNRKILIAEIQNSSKNGLKHIEKSLKERLFWKEEQMIIIKDSHIRFLKEEFLDIIQFTFSKKLSDVMFENNYEILEKQIENDNKIIDGLFKPYKETIKTKQKSREQCFKDLHQKGTNYSMKETENVREIKVTVEIEQKLDNVIEQDF